MANLARSLTDSAAAHGDRPAVRLDGTTLTCGGEHPRVVWLVDELTKGPTGTILEREISVPEGVR